MKKFSDFGIEVKKNAQIFEVPRISITDVINCEIVVIAFQKGVKTIHGDGRYIIKVRHEGNECKFFTTSEGLKEALDKIPEDGFPFTTTIKQKSHGTGNGKTFYFS